MTRILLLQQIYDRLGRLEESREINRLDNKATDQFDIEMKELRIKVQHIMNSQCPILKEITNGCEKD